MSKGIVEWENPEKYNAERSKRVGWCDAVTPKERKELPPPGWGNTGIKCRKQLPSPSLWGLKGRGGILYLEDYRRKSHRTGAGTSERAWIT